MKYLIALFTSKVVTDTMGRSIYIDPITKTGYALKGNLARQKNILPIRAVFALFAFLVLYSIAPDFEGIQLWPFYAVASVLGLIIFEIRLYTKILPKCSQFPNYQVVDQTPTLSSLKRNTLFVLYGILIVLLAIQGYLKQDPIIYLSIFVLLVIVCIRLYKLIAKKH